MIGRVQAFCLWLGLAAALASAALAQETVRVPEAATGSGSKDVAVASRHMAAAAHPLAAEAGRDILRAGGSAVDAAIAMQLVLGLVEPQSSGLGGGAFVVHFNAAKGEVKTYDGRETAPASAKPDRFLKNGQPIDFDEAVRSSLSIGVPGVMRVMELAHQQHGQLPWARLFEPAITLADAGFLVSQRLHLLLRWQSVEHFSPAARAYFFDEAGAARPNGYLLKNPAYAATLRALAERGALAFYDGPIADAIVDAVNSGPAAHGDVTRADLSGYQAKERAPVCFAYRTHKICGMGPPSSGGITIAQTLKLIEPFAQVHGADAKLSGAALHVIAEAEKLAYADRNRYLADPDVIAIPGGLLDDAYLAERRKLIDVTKAMAKPAAGLPPGLAKRSFGWDATHEAVGTSHISVVDDAGNAVAMTTTIESAFGSGHWAAGFLLNNQLTDFSFRPIDPDGAPIANAVAGGKRPRSSMSPTIVLDAAGAFEAATGSPGGSRIILFVIKTLIAMLDWGLDPQAAAALINFGSEGGPLVIEYGLSSIWPALLLKGYGHAVSAELLTSGVHTIMRRGGRLEGGADPRRDGVALGD